MRAILTCLAVMAAAPATAQSCNPPILTFRGDTLTYETPATDVYASGGVAAIVDDYVEGRTVLIDAHARTTQNINLAEVTLAELQVLVGAERVAFIGPARCRPNMPGLPEDLFDPHARLPADGGASVPKLARRAAGDDGGHAPDDLFQTLRPQHLGDVANDECRVDPNRGKPLGDRRVARDF